MDSEESSLSDLNLLESEVEEVQLSQSQSWPRHMTSKRKRKHAPQEQPFMDSWLQLAEFKS